MILKISKQNQLESNIRLGRGFICKKKDARMWVTKSKAYFNSVKSSLTID